jgi:hypothetical protein
MSGNMKGFLNKAEVVTAMKTLSSNFKTESTKQTKDISSRITSKLTSKFQVKTQEISKELTASIRAETVKLNEVLSKKFMMI